MIYNIKLGQVVRCLTAFDGNEEVKDKVGFIRYIAGPTATVQFFDKVGGHAGFDNTGHDGHCWNINKSDLVLLYEGTLIPEAPPVMPPPKPVPAFKLGDIVSYIPDEFPATDYRGPFTYALGMVRVIDMEAALPYGVEFFSDFKGGHDLGGKLSDGGYGWWVEGTELKLRHRIKDLDKCIACKEKYGIDEDDEDDDA